ncbi:MAG: GNAT family N-acetyltransferase [Anaerolineaceae bacterium]|nr:GNAT family N-acetyltransferase [Anaerolineaceae bacterium]
MRNIKVESSRGDYRISTDRELLSVDAIHAYLTRSYWAEGRSRETVAASLEGSINFGLYYHDQQVGLTRLVTDFATFYWICDVYVLEEHRGKGLGKWMMECVVACPEFKDLLGVLATTNTHGLYEKFGFVVPDEPRKFMRKNR